MPTLNPSLEVIKLQKVQPTLGEWTFLDFLLDNLDDSYEVYFQPFLNGDNPDFAIMRKGSGVLLIEVKDWNLESYYLDEKTRWRLKKDNTFIKSPLHQVDNYKENLFQLHIEELFYKNIRNKNHWATVNCAVYFHNATQEQLNNFLIEGFQIDSKEKDYRNYRKYLGHFGIIGHDSLAKINLDNLLTKFWLNKSSYYFDDILYNSFYRFLKSPIHQIEDGIKINYSKEQQELIRSEISPRRKIKGVAGSGKTLVLAKRAVNAHKRTNGKILILTYNLSLKNYIHDRINDVREEFHWNNFYITNYHQFFKTQANNYNLEINGIESWSDIAFFESIKDQIIRFDVVLIDEIQDYMQEWIDIITRYFIKSDSEFVVFGDEKQNIYERTLDENNEPIVRTILGNWNRTLNNSFRFGSNISKIAINFQKSIFGNKYRPDEIGILSQLDYEQRIIEYHFFNEYNAQILLENIYSVLTKNIIHSSDTGILCSKVDVLREIDFLIRTNKNEKTTTTFESKEEIDKIKNDIALKYRDMAGCEDKNESPITNAIHNKLEEIRKLKKNHFWMKTGTMKLSTIHSFKGWEIDTLFLIIEKEEDDFTNSELIYTGLTRARKNLIIFNLGNIRYDAFFKVEIESRI
jgi:hypothetical protein